MGCALVCRWARSVGAVEFGEGGPIEQEQLRSALLAPIHFDRAAIVHDPCGERGAFNVQLLARPPHLKRPAPNDFYDHRRPTVIVSRGVAHDVANGRLIVVFDTAAEGIDEQLLDGGTG